MEFAEVVEKLETNLRRIAYNITGNKADQDDLLQEGWLYLWENREKLNHKTTSYLLRGCYFHFVDYLRQGSSIDSKLRENVTVISLYSTSGEGQASFISDIPSRVADAMDVLVAKDLKEQVKKRLNVRLKETYDLLVQGYSCGEIARKFRLTHEAARLRIKMIRKVVKEYLAKNLDF